MDFMNNREDTVSTMYKVSTVLSVVSLLVLVKHCISTVHLSQPTFLVSKVGALVSVALALPYQWEKPLARYRMLLTGCIYATIVFLLVLGVAFGRKRGSAAHDSREEEIHSADVHARSPEERERQRSSRYPTG
jgi:hypothetical protein